MAAHCSGCVFTVCVCTLDGLNTEHEFPSMGHHTWLYVTSLSVSASDLQVDSPIIKSTWGQTTLDPQSKEWELRPNAGLFRYAAHTTDIRAVGYASGQSFTPPTTIRYLITEAPEVRLYLYVNKMLQLVDIKTNMDYRDLLISKASYIWKFEDRRNKI